MHEELVQILRDCRKPPYAGDTACKKCPFLYGSADGSEICLDRLIGAAADAIEELNKRVPPVPHGRLIDADVLTELCRDMQSIEWNKHAAPYSWAYAYEDFENVILDAPAIIEAEEATQ